VPKCKIAAESKPHGRVGFAWTTSGSVRRVSRCRSFASARCRLGSSAWKGWVLDEDDSIPILRRALDLGITFFDMADWYSTGRNEEVVGRNLLKMSARERLVLATKGLLPHERRPERSWPVAQAHRHRDRPVADADGYRLLDLYVIHAFDAGTPVEETMEALHDTVRAARCRYLGGPHPRCMRGSSRR